MNSELAMTNYPEAARYILAQIERCGVEEPRRIVRLTEHLAALTRMAALADIRREEGSWGAPYENYILKNPE
jgi:hypothetical protein